MRKGEIDGAARIVVRIGGDRIDELLLEQEHRRLCGVFVRKGTRVDLDPPPALTDEEVILLFYLSF